jgi:hypothetical protein
LTGSPRPEQAITLLCDAVAVLQARAEMLAAAGKREWPISPAMPALVIIIDEYAELADEASAAMSDTDSIARLGRAVAVALIAATQRPTQKAMEQGAVPSQMDFADMLPCPRTEGCGPDSRAGNAPGRMGCPQSQRAREIPHLSARPRPAQAGPRLPAHRPGCHRNRQTLCRLPAGIGRRLAARDRFRTPSARASRG